MQNIAAAGAGAIGGSGGAGVGAAVAVNVVGNTTTASIGDAEVDAAGGLTVLARASLQPLTLDLPVLDDDPKVTAVALGGAVSQGGAAVAGSFVVNVFTDNTSATIADDAQINQRPGLVAPGTDQHVTVRAEDDMQVFDLAGALAGSLDSAGIGAAVDVQVLTQNTTASIGSSARVDANGSVTVNARATQDQFAVAANVGFSNSSVTVGGAVSVLVDNNTTRAFIGAGAVVAADGNVFVEASQDTIVEAIAGNAGVSTSSAAVGVSNTTLVHNDTVEAYHRRERPGHRRGQPSRRA